MQKLLSGLTLLMMFAQASAGEPLPDFKLRDMNPLSPRRNSEVTPRDYLLQVSGYYFGAAG